MSDIPNCTRTLVKDLVFQRKYKLTATQTDFISYITRLASWAICMGDDFHILVTSKIEDDLKLKTKVIEAAITKLIKLGLIETKLVKAPDWDSNKNFRAIRLTEKGKEYNSAYLKPKDLRMVDDLKISVKSLQEEILELKKELNKKDKKPLSSVTPTFNREVLLPLINQRILGNGGEVFIVNRIKLVLDGVEVRLQNEKTFQFTPIAFNDCQTLNPQIAQKWLLERQKAYQKKHFEDSFLRLLNFLHLVVFFKNQEYIVKEINREKDFKISIQIENQEDKNSLKLHFSPPQAMNFLENGLEKMMRQ